MYKAAPQQWRRRMPNSAFALVEKVAKAHDFQELLTLQVRFAQEQMRTYTNETQELQKLIGEGFQKLQNG